MRTKENVTVTHECDLGYFVRECDNHANPERDGLFLIVTTCEPGISEFCKFCPRHPEVGCFPGSWLAEQEAEWKELFKKDRENFLKSLQ